MALNNRKNQKLEEFKENPGDKNKKHLWKAVKNIEGRFTSKFVQVRNKEGRLVQLNKETIADYLEEEHWHNPTSDERERVTRNSKLRRSHNKDEQALPFTIQELKDMIKLTKRS